MLLSKYRLFCRIFFIDVISHGFPDFPTLSNHPVKVNLASA